MKTWLLAIALILSTVLTARAQEDETKLPDPPEGFSWERFPEMNAAFVCPAKWFVKRVTQKGTVAGFITQEEIVNGGKFTTGLTVNYLTKFSEKGAKKKPSEFSVLFAKEATAGLKTLVPPSVKEMDRIKVTIFRVEKDGTVVHHLLVADDKFDTLHIVIFESTVKEWDAAWKKGEVILKKVYFKFPD